MVGGLDIKESSQNFSELEFKNNAPYAHTPRDPSTEALYTYQNHGFNSGTWTSGGRVGRLASVQSSLSCISVAYTSVSDGA